MPILTKCGRNGIVVMPCGDSGGRQPFEMQLTHKRYLNATSGGVKVVGARPHAIYWERMAQMRRALTILSRCH